jgi:hypothetical protein
MDLTTLLILIVIYLVLIVISMFIEDKTYKLYYFLIVALATLTFLNVYLSIVYYIKLRNEPGIPGPRGPKGEKGPGGGKGKCVISESCGFTSEEANKLLYSIAASKFDSTTGCVKSPSLKTCKGGASEVERILPVNKQIAMLEKMANNGQFTKQEFEAKVRRSFDAI